MWSERSGEERSGGEEEEDKGVGVKEWVQLEVRKGGGEREVGSVRRGGRVGVGREDSLALHLYARTHTRTTLPINQEMDFFAAEIEFGWWWWWWCMVESVSH